MFGFGTFVSFADNTGVIALVSFSVVVVFEAFGAEIYGAEEARYTGNGVKMIIVYQIDVDTGALVGTGAGNKLVSQSGADHHHAYSEASSNAAKSSKLAGLSNGTSANLLSAIARSFCSFLFVCTELV